MSATSFIHSSPSDGFIASTRLAESLQRVLVDLTALHLDAKQAHWNVVGPNFRDLHLALDEIVTDARDASDIIAERMRAVGAVPDGRPDTVARASSLPAFPAGEQSTRTVIDLTVSLLRATAATVRAVHDDVDDADPSTADLLHNIITMLEKHAWLVGSENREL